jgi:hypothetical protein
MKNNMLAINGELKGMSLSASTHLTVWCKRKFENPEI